MPAFIEILIERFISILFGWRWRTYHQYLQSFVWSSKRARIRKRDGNACKVCNSHRRLQVHHREYPSRWGMEPDDDLTLLCDRCHHRHHGAAH